MRENTTPSLAHTVPDACRRLGIGRTLTYQLIAKGELRTIKIGSRTLIPESELQRLVADRLSGGAAGETDVAQVPHARTVSQ